MLVVAAGATRATSEMRHSVITLEAGLPVAILLAVCILSLLGVATTGMALATSATFCVATVVMSVPGRLAVPHRDQERRDALGMSANP